MLTFTLVHDIATVPLVLVSHWCNTSPSLKTILIVTSLSRFWILNFFVVVSNSVNNLLRNMVIMYMRTRIKKVDELKKLTKGVNEMLREPLKHAPFNY